jgi:uncharacterized protein YkwD
MKKLFYLLLVVSFISCENIQYAEPQHVNLYQGEWEYWPIESQPQMVDQVIQFTNEYRVDKGLPQLAKGSGFAGALAAQHCNYMIYTGRISHDGFEHRAELLSNNGAKAVGENVAFGYNDPWQVVDAWIKSPEHEEVILGDYTHVSVGAIKDVFGDYFYTQIFYRN